MKRLLLYAFGALLVLQSVCCLYEVDRVANQRKQTLETFSDANLQKYALTPADFSMISGLFNRVLTPKTPYAFTELPKKEVLEPILGVLKSPSQDANGPPHPRNDACFIVYLAHLCFLADVTDRIIQDSIKELQMKSSELFPLHGHRVQFVPAQFKYYRFDPEEFQARDLWAQIFTGFRHKVDLWIRLQDLYHDVGVTVYDGFYPITPEIDLEKSVLTRLAFQSWGKFFRAAFAGLKDGYFEDEGKLKACVDEAKPLIDKIYNWYVDMDQQMRMVTMVWDKYPYLHEGEDSDALKAAIYQVKQDNAEVAKLRSDIVAAVHNILKQVARSEENSDLSRMRELDKMIEDKVPPMIQAAYTLFETLRRKIAINLPSPPEDPQKNELDINVLKQAMAANVAEQIQVAHLPVQAASANGLSLCHEANIQGQVPGAPMPEQVLAANILGQGNVVDPPEQAQDVNEQDQAIGVQAPEQVVASQDGQTLVPKKETEVDKAPDNFLSKHRIVIVPGSILLLALLAWTASSMLNKNRPIPRKQSVLNQNSVRLQVMSATSDTLAGRSSTADRPLMTAPDYATGSRTLGTNTPPQRRNGSRDRSSGIWSLSMVMAATCWLVLA